MLNVNPTTSWLFFSSLAAKCFLMIQRTHKQTAVQGITIRREERIQDEDSNKALINYKISAAIAASSERSVRSKNICPNIGYFLNLFTVNVKALESLSK